MQSRVWLLGPSDNTQTRQKLQRSRTFSEDKTWWWGYVVWSTTFPNGTRQQALRLAALGTWTMTFLSKVAWELPFRTAGGHAGVSRERRACPRSWSRASGSPARFAEHGQGYGSLTLTSLSKLPDLDAQRSKVLPS